MSAMTGNFWEAGSGGADVAIPMLSTPRPRPRGIRSAVTQRHQPLSLDFTAWEKATRSSLQAPMDHRCCSVVRVDAGRN